MNRIMMFGREQLVDEEMYLEWREWKGIVGGRHEGRASQAK